MKQNSTSLPIRFGSRTRRTAILAVFVLALVACSGDTNGATDAADGGGESTATVSIDNFEFVPAELTVDIGTTVTWTNVQAAQHTVTGDDAEFDSADLAEGAEFSQVFDTAGTFTYHCEIHPTMTASVIVEG